MDLSKLTTKQQLFVMEYLLNGNNGRQAYKKAYNCKQMADKSIDVEVSRLLKNPKVSQWLNHYQSNAQEVIEEEFEYTVKEAFAELNDLMDRCKRSFKTYNVEKSCIDTKCKIAGLMKDKVEHSAEESIVDLLSKLK